GAASSTRARSGRRHDALHFPHPRRRPRRLARASGAHALSRRRARRALGLWDERRLYARARRLLARRLRLARRRGEAQRLSAVQARQRRHRPAFSACSRQGATADAVAAAARLTDPAAFGGAADAFTVVAPSLPGYGLSFRPGQQRYGVEEIASAMVELMGALGYERFAVQGGDWGAITASHLGAAYAHKLIGLHVNMLAVPRDRAAVAPDHAAFAAELKHWLDEETGYQWIQGTKPQTLSFALSDSPAGLAAWIVEKFRSWSDCGGDAETALTRDQMLANISFYWFTGAIGSSFYPYYYRRRRPWPVSPQRPATAPTGYAQFPKEMLRPPRALAEQSFTDIRRWSVMPKGGHFAAMEQPQALAA